MISTIGQTQYACDKTAIVVNDKTYSYNTLHKSSKAFARVLLKNDDDLQQQRVAFMVTPGFDYVKTLWAIWLSGGVAVPLCLTHPFPSLQYVLEDTDAAILVVSPEYRAIIADYAVSKNIRLIETCDALPVNDKGDLPDIGSSRNAMILYTSGTTNKPKGVVSTHANLNAQVSTLVNAWEWSANDHTLCVLPLHHVHGIVNVVSCSMWSGATCQFLPAFSAEAIFNIFLEGKLNVFMAVPTIFLS